MTNKALLNIGAFTYVMCFGQLNFSRFLSQENYPLTQFFMCYPQLSALRVPFDLRDSSEKSISGGIPILQFRFMRRKYAYYLCSGTVYSDELSESS